MWVLKNSFVWKRCFILALFLCLNLLVSSVGSSLGDETTGVAKEWIKIGLMGDFTGPAAEGWIQIADGARSFFNMVNYAGGIHGRKIKYIFEDDRYSIPLALSAFKKLVYKDKIFVLQAASGVGHTAAIIPLAEREKLPLIAATGEKKYFVPARKYLFSPIPWYEDQAKLVFEYILDDMKLKNPTIALMHPDTASGKDTREAVRKLVKAYPTKKYKEITFSLTALDYTSEMLTLKRLKPDVIYLHGLVIDTSLIVKAAHRLGVNTPIIVNQYGCSDEVMAIAGNMAKTLIAINCFGTWDNDSPGVKTLKKAAMSYDPKVHRRSAYFFQGWIAGIMFCEGFKKAGRDLTREAYLKGMESIRNHDTQGICGVVTFGPNDHKAIDSHRFYRADTEQKRFVPISEWRKPIE